MGFATIFGAMMSAALKTSINNGIIKAGSAAQARQAAASPYASSYGAARAGTYGDSAFTDEQLKNAATIAGVGKTLGASSRDIQIALMTAMQESTLRNLDWGDRDSVGLFQQRDAWGSFADRTNPAKAARMFFLGGAAGQRGLFDFPERNSMSLAQAAQAVQVSAYPDAYAKWADEAAAIMKAMTRAPAGTNAAGYTPGEGGWHKPSIPGKGWANTHDYGNGIGSPLFAASDGVIVDSRAITSGGSPGNGRYATPYRSYGETIAMRTASGDILRYAHLNPGERYVSAGQKVKGGALIGRSGMTGNATGPHTHFDVNGNYNASGWMAAKGISLSKGAANVRWDNTLANLHKGEAVLTEDLNKKFHQGVERFANGGETVYNLNMNFGSVSNKDEIAQHVINTIKRAEARKPKPRGAR
jgi:murein DD-endopeptidase MepM/ murein hydrolase activator NlpD